MLQFSRDYHSRFLWVIAVLFVLCAVLRLARFNVETDEEDTHEFFSGLPAPAAAGLIASFPIAMHGLVGWKESADPNDTWFVNLLDWLMLAMKQGLPFIMLAAAFLMVSRIRYVHVFNAFIRGRHSRKHLIQIVFTLAIIIVFNELALPLVLCYITFLPPVQAFWKEFRSGRFSFRERTSQPTETSSLDDADDEPEINSGHELPEESEEPHDNSSPLM